MVLGFLGLAYATVVGVLDRDEPLIGVLVGLVSIPAVAPAVFGYHMMRGRAWAAWWLRVWFLAALVVGIAMDVVGGLDVLSFPLLAVPLVSILVLWIVLSFL